MAVFGLGQGAAVGLILGSSAIFFYTIAGGALWNWLLRPLEERRLVEQFGADYERYRRMVRCWRPNLAPYSSSASTRCA